MFQPERNKMCDVLIRLLACAFSCLPLAVCGSPADIVINEIMYNLPDDGSGDELEYVELHNRGTEDIDVGGWQLSYAVAFALPPGTIIKAGGYLVVCSDVSKMALRYGVYNTIGPFDGRLANEGECVVLSDDSPVPVLIDEVSYGTGEEWPGEPDGNGPSLELLNPWADNNIGGNWHASDPPENNGTPGVQNSCYQENPPPAITGVTRNPLAPASTQSVTLTAAVQDDTSVQEVRLIYAAGDDPDGAGQTISMNRLTGGCYSATIPAQSNGTWVWHMIEATDDMGGIGYWPADAPTKKAWYCVENLPVTDAEIVINEIMYHNTPEMGEDLEWVEVFNAGSRTIDLSLWCLKDDEDSHAFYLPMGTSLSPGEFLVIAYDSARTMSLYGIQDVIGDFSFRFSNGGSAVRLFNANGILVDRVEYGDSSPWSELADGEGASLECVNPSADNLLFSNWGPGLSGGSPGYQNSIYSPSNHDTDIVINEIMYHPANEDDNGQFVELFNKGSQSVDLSDWKITRGLTHEFPWGTTIPGGEYLVLCMDVATVQGIYHFAAPAMRWDMGRLDHGGETLALENSVGATIDIVKYDDEAPWPVAADGFGSSLECINPFVENNHPRNWGASSGEPYWQFVQRVGVPTSALLTFYMLEPGECLIDDVSITDAGGTYNYVPNGTFETDESGWQKTGNHSGSYREEGQGHSGRTSMHIVGTDTGTGYTNSVNIYTVPDLVRDQLYSLSFWVKHVKGSTRLYSSLWRGGLGGETVLAGSGLLCSPGSHNTVYSLDLPPFISVVQHTPSMPKPSQVGKIVAAVEDDVQVTSVTLQYKSALSTTWTTVGMHDDGVNGDEASGDGLYTAVTTTYPSQTVVQYAVTALDDAGNRTRSPASNDPKPNNSYFVYSLDVVSKLPVFFMTIPNMGSMDPWSDNYYPATFIYEGRVYENVGVRYRGGTSRSYPKKCLKIRFNKGDLFGTFFDEVKSIDLNSMWADKSYLREKLAFDMFKKMGVAYCETRHVLLYINGSYWGLFLEMEAPGRRYLKRNGRDDTGNLYKSYDTGTNPGGFEKKTNETDASIADLESFLWGINNTPEEQITDFLNTHTMVDSQIAYNAVGCVIGSADQPHKNHFLYHDPTSDKWEMFPWDLDLTYGRNYYPGLGVCNDSIRWDSHIFLCTRIHPNYDNFWNRIIDRFFYPEDSPYTEPFRTNMIETTKYILDNFFTLPLQYEEINSLAELIKEEAVRDRGKWGSYNSVDVDLEAQVSILDSFVANRRNYLYANFLTDRNAPRQPRNVSPRDGDYTVCAPADLRATAYSDPSADAHTASQWQVREDGRYWDETVVDTGEDGENMTSYEVPADVLSPLKAYYWRVRYKDSTGCWGNWSDETSFAIGIDTDADGLCDSVETDTGVYVSPRNTGADPRNPDTDGDGLRDGEEVLEFRTNPTLADSDEDGLTDWDEVKTHLTNPNNKDTDSDGLPDGWEVANLLDAKSTTGPNGASGDPDADRMTNLDEMIAGTDPNSAQSVFAVTSIRPNDPGMTITWRTVQGKRYQVYVSEDLAGEWSPMGLELVGTSESETSVDEAADSARVRYYKVLVY